MLSLPSPLGLSFSTFILVVLVNRAHRKCRKRPADFQLQDDHRDLAGAGPDGDLAFEIGGIRLGEELLNKRGYPASALNGPASFASGHP